jgi:hypothetical protein
MSLFHQIGRNLTRRHFFGQSLHALGWAALGNLLAAERGSGTVPATHHPARAKHVIFVHAVGGPAQMDLFDYKPNLADFYDGDLPESVRRQQKLTCMTGSQVRFPIAPSKYRFRRHGQAGTWLSELLPWTAKMADDLCLVRSMHTEAINHEPAITYLQTGSQVAGKPCLGAWVSYGLGSLNRNLPTFVVLVARPTNKEQFQAISARLWQAGYLPGEHCGVSLRSAGDPILYVANPPGVSPEVRRRTLDEVKALNEIRYEEVGDPEIRTRIAQYEMAFRMQSSVPELADLSREGEATFRLYGESARTAGTFANTVLKARRLVERGVRFVQVYHNNWDTHNNTAGRLPEQCRDVDKPCYALVQDLKQRGLLDSTLIVWAGEFGRTIYCQGKLTRDNYGRDHHSGCFTIWLAGGGVKAGQVYGETDDFSCNVVKDAVHVRDLHATLLHLLGFDHRRLSVRHQGLDQRLTGVEPAQVVRGILA